MTVFDQLGVATLVNAKGPATRLSGGIMRSEVVQAMAEASQHCVDIAQLQAAASREIAAATGAEAGYVASGASACLLLATAACMTGLDPGRMARLPDARGMKNEVVMVRSQRNFYDHAVRAAGATLVEVGLPDRFAGAGVRDAEPWEIADAITERTAAVFYVADALARPPLADVAAVAHAHRVPVIVDAAAQMPPAANLRRFVAEGADLVAYSGGKALGGPQASGILCGRRDLVMAAALQHLDLDVHWPLWEPPPELIDKSRLRGAPQHGIGRSCKAGKEEIVGLLTALRLFVSETDASRHARWLSVVRQLAAALGDLPGLDVSVTGASSHETVPTLTLAFDRRQYSASTITLALQRQRPAIIVNLGDLQADRIEINPMCLRPDDADLIIRGLRRALRETGQEPHHA